MKLERKRGLRLWRLLYANGRGVEISFLCLGRGDLGVVLKPRDLISHKWMLEGQEGSLGAGKQVSVD